MASDATLSPYRFASSLRTRSYSWALRSMHSKCEWDLVLVTPENAAVDALFGAFSNDLVEARSSCLLLTSSWSGLCFRIPRINFQLMESQKTEVWSTKRVSVQRRGVFFAFTLASRNKKQKMFDANSFLSNLNIKSPPFLKWHHKRRPCQLEQLGVELLEAPWKLESNQRWTRLWVTILPSSIHTLLRKEES